MNKTLLIIGAGVEACEGIKHKAQSTKHKTYDTMWIITGHTNE